MLLGSRANSIFAIPLALNTMRSPVRALLTLLLLLPLPVLAQHTPAPLTGASAMTIGRGILGMLVIIGIAWAFSAKRKQVDW